MSFLFFFSQHCNKLKKRNLAVGWKNFAQEQEVWAHEDLFSVKPLYCPSCVCVCVEAKGDLDGK